MLASLGDLERRRGNRGEARLKMEKSLNIMKEIHYDSGIAWMSFLLGRIEEDEGHYAQADRLYQESLKIYEEGTEGMQVAAVRAQQSHRVQQGHLACRQGDFSRACALYVESLPPLYEVYHDRIGIVECLEGLAACSPGHPTRAAQLLGAAEALREAMGAPLPPCAQQEHTAVVSAARKALGDEEFTAAFAAGKALTLEETMAMAMEAC